MTTKANFVFIFIICCYGCVSMGADVSYMRKTITDHFSEVRNHFVDTAYKEAAKQFIYDEFKRFGLETEYHEFTHEGLATNATSTFVNVVGVVKGSRFGTAEDKIIGVGAHYDTVSTSKGVDDNGSGVAAMLEAARQLAEANITRTNTLIFASFDLEEYGLIGSKEFMKTWVTPWLSTHYGGAIGSLMPHGVIVLDTMMEYNTSQNSQIVLDDQIMRTYFPTAYNSVSGDGFRGDFLNLIYRSPTADASLARAFMRSWDQSSRKQFELEALPIPVENPSALGANTREIYNLLRSDHSSFWAFGIPAIFITDSADFRGDMKYCYHQMCDDLDTMLTDDNLNFLGKTADTIAKTVNALSPEYTNGKDTIIASHGLVIWAAMFVLTRDQAWN